MALVKSIMKQGVDDERDIDFDDIDNNHSVSDNKYHWHKLKKLVSSRCDTDVAKLAKDLVSYLAKNRGEKKYSYHSKKDAELETTKKGINRLSLLTLYREKFDF